MAPAMWFYPHTGEGHALPSVPKYGPAGNLSPLHRPPQPALDSGRVQKRIRRAYVATGKPVLSTSELMRGRIRALAGIDTIIAELFVALLNAIASASVAAAASAGRSCGDCATDPRIDQFPFDTLLLFI